MAVQRFSVAAIFFVRRQPKSDVLALRARARRESGDAMASLLWAGTLRAQPGSHHHCENFERNYIRHEGVTLNSSHIDPKLTHSSLPPKAADLRKFQSDGTPIDHPRRNTVHLLGQNAPWANVDNSLLVEDF